MAPVGSERRLTPPLPALARAAAARLQGDVVGLKVNKLSSTKTQLPYEYYSLPYCQPDPIVNSAENLGEVLRGDRIENSLYQIEIRHDEQCKTLCKVSLDEKSAKEFSEKVRCELVRGLRGRAPAAARPPPAPMTPRARERARSCAAAARLC